MADMVVKSPKTPAGRGLQGYPSHGGVIQEHRGCHHDCDREMTNPGRDPVPFSRNQQTQDEPQTDSSYNLDPFPTPNFDSSEEDSQPVWLAEAFG